MLTTKNWALPRFLPAALGAGLLWLAGCAPSGPQALLQGERLIREGEFAQAIDRLKIATRLLPENAQAWNHLGLAYHNAGRADEAVLAYRSALKHNPNLAAVRFNLGALYLEQNNPAASVPELATFTVLQRDSVEGWLKLGTAQLRARQFDGAEASFQAALRLKPGVPEALNGLGVTHAQRRRMRDAAILFTRALQSQTNYTPALLNLAAVTHTFDRPQALKLYRGYTAVKPAPPNLEAVQDVIKKLEAELNPPPRVTMAPPVAPTTQAVAILKPPTVTPVRPTNPPPVQIGSLASVPPPTGPARATPPAHAPQPVRTPVVAQAPATQPPQVPPQPAPVEVAKIETPPAPVQTPVPETPKPASPPAPRIETPPPTTTVVQTAPVTTVVKAPAARPPTVQTPPPSAPAPQSPATATPGENPPGSQAGEDFILLVGPRVVKKSDGTEETKPQARTVDKDAVVELEESVGEKTSREEKRSFTRRMNPANWFRREKNQEVVTPLDPEARPRRITRTEPDEPAPAPPRTFARATPAGTRGAVSPPNTGGGASAVVSEEPPPVVESLPTAPPQVPKPAAVSVRRYTFLSPARPAAGSRSSAEQSLRRGFEAHQSRDLTAALEAYRESARRDPSLFEAHYNIGVAAMELGDWSTSLPSYETALSINPTSTSARYNFSVALERAGYPLDAVSQLEKLVAERPNEARAHFALGRIHAEQLQQEEAAARHYRRALELEPQHPQGTAIRRWLVNHGGR